jgi:hypothetical protein
MQVDDWLEREIQKVISDEEVDAFFSLRRVAEFILEHPGKPLPDELLSLLINFLQTKHELKELPGEPGRANTSLPGFPGTCPSQGRPARDG